MSTPPSYRSQALALILPLTAARLLLASHLGLGDAEAYYWSWSRSLAVGYYDHGPLVAWLVRLGTAIGGPTSFGVRLPFIAISSVTLWGTGLLAARLAGVARAGVWSILALLSMPAFLVAGAAANPDVPLLGLVLAFVWLLHLLDQHSSSSRRDLLVVSAGLCAGLATSTKLLGGLLVAPLVWVAWQQPRRWRTLGVSLGSALLGAAPVLVWNAHHGWLSFVYHLRDRHSRPPGFSLENLGKLVGGQLGYFTPWVIVALGAALVSLWRARRSGVGGDGVLTTPGEATRRALLGTSLVCLGTGYLLTLVVPGAEPHWPAPGYLPLVVGLGVCLPRWLQRRAIRVAALAGVGCSLLLGTLLHLHALTDVGVRHMPAGYVPRFDLTNELRGWPEVAQAIVALPPPEHGSGQQIVVGCHYTVCAQLAFAARDRFPVYCLSPRMDQFVIDGHGHPDCPRGVDLDYVRDERFPFEAEELYRCARVTQLASVEIRRAERVVRRFEIQRCAGYQGLRARSWPPRAPAQVSISR